MLLFIGETSVVVNIVSVLPVSVSGAIYKSGLLSITESRMKSGRSFVLSEPKCSWNKCVVPSNAVKSRGISYGFLCSNACKT